MKTHRITGRICRKIAWFFMARLVLRCFKQGKQLLVLPKAARLFPQEFRIRILRELRCNGDHGFLACTPPCMNPTKTNMNRNNDKYIYI